MSDPLSAEAGPAQGWSAVLDLLLDQARKGRVDLAQISMLDLVEETLAALDMSAPLPERADRIVLVSELIALKSRLLLPAGESAAEESDLRARLEKRAFIRAAAGLLLERERLGRDFFARGEAAGWDVSGRRREEGPGLMALLQAYIRVDLRHVVTAPHRPAPPVVLTPQRALEALTGGLPEAWSPVGAMAASLRNVAPQHAPAASLLASTFAAALELTKQGAAEMRAEPGRQTHVRARPARQSG